MLWAIITPSANMRLHNVTPVQKWHLSIGLDPNLVSSVLCEDGKGGDVKSEFAGLREFTWGVSIIVQRTEEDMST